MPGTRNSGRCLRERARHPHEACCKKGRPLYYQRPASVSLRVCLERQLQSQLNDARTAGRDIALRAAGIRQRLRDLAVVAVIECSRRVVEHRVIEDDLQSPDVQQPGDCTQ